ncbi:hypothetical protein B0H11DRAFT_1803782 [Mycena galericulata]|nr:hypothetical protein B0H11DRAFT_1803782 [Mycena galericulata]
MYRPPIINIQGGSGGSGGNGGETGGSGGVGEGPPVTIYNNVDGQSCLNALRCARDAGPSASKTCLPGTRVALLSRIRHWALNPTSARTILLHGAAGTGKSAIANTIVRQLQSDDLAVVPFFAFNRSVPDRSSSQLIPTWAKHLAQANPRYLAYLDTLYSDPRGPGPQQLESSDIQEQRDGLLIKGLSSGIDDGKLLIFTIDALDECPQEEATQLLQVLGELLSGPNLPPFVRFIFTYRSDGEIHRTFDGLSTLNILIDDEEGAVEDIRKFVHAQPYRHPEVTAETTAQPIGGVTSVVFSADGKRIVSGSYDQTVCVWDSESGEAVAGPFEGHTDGVNSVAFSADGKQIVSGSYDDQTVRAWDSESGEVVAGPFEGHTDGASSVAFSADAKPIVSGSDDETVRMWDSESREVVAMHELPPHLAQDPGLAAVTKTLRTLLNHPEYSSDVLRLVESYPALVDEATRVFEKHCTGSYPIAQGGSNTVFLLTFEDGSDALARVRGGLSAEPPECSSELLASQFLSEVATIAYVRKHTSIPVPEVYHSDSDPKNALGTRYMFMQRIAGENLGTAWQSMSHEQREGVVTELAHMEAQLLQRPLPMIGSIIDDDGTVGPLGPSSTDPFTLRDPFCGPFASSKHLMEAYIRSELSRISDCNEWLQQRTFWSNHNGGAEDMLATYAVRWFSLLLAAIHAVPSEDFGPPHFILCQDDLDLNNILVSPSGTVVGLVDWQGSSVHPLWNAPRPTHFLQDESLVDDQQERDSLREIHQDILNKARSHPGSSQLRLRYLLHITSYSHSILSSRAHPNTIFLRWFANVVVDGNEEKLEPFLPLKSFIEAHQLFV